MYWPPVFHFVPKLFFNIFLYCKIIGVEKKISPLKPIFEKQINTFGGNRSISGKQNKKNSNWKTEIGIDFEYDVDDNDVDVDTPKFEIQLTFSLGGGYLAGLPREKRNIKRMFVRCECFSACVWMGERVSMCMRVFVCACVLREWEARESSCERPMNQCESAQDLCFSTSKADQTMPRLRILM